MSERSGNLFTTILIITLLMTIAGMIGYMVYTEQRGDDPLSRLTSSTNRRSDTSVVVPRTAINDVEVAGEQVTAPPNSDSALLDRIKKLVALPTLPAGTEPIIAAVSDATKLRSEDDFFALAKDGDTLVIYGAAAVLYRESVDRVVATAPVPPGGFGSEPEPVPVAQPLQPLPIDIQLLDVSKIGGPVSTTLEVRRGAAAQETAEEMTVMLRRLPWVTKATLGTSEGVAPGETYIIDQTGGRRLHALYDLSSRFGGKVLGSMPAGSPPSNAEIVLIFGP